MTKNAHDEADIFTTPGDISISIDDEYDNYHHGNDHDKTGKARAGPAHSNEAARHPLRRPTQEVQSAAEAAGNQAQRHGTPGAASRTCPNESPHKSLTYT